MHFICGMCLSLLPHVLAIYSRVVESSHDGASVTLPSTGSPPYVVYVDHDANSPQMYRTGKWLLGPAKRGFQSLSA